MNRTLIPEESMLSNTKERTVRDKRIKDVVMEMFGTHNNLNKTIASEVFNTG